MIEKAVTNLQKMKLVIDDLIIHAMDIVTKALRTAQKAINDYHSKAIEWIGNTKKKWHQKIMNNTEIVSAFVNLTIYTV